MGPARSVTSHQDELKTPVSLCLIILSCQMGVTVPQLVSQVKSR